MPDRPNALSDAEDARWTLEQRLAARRDPRYPALLDELTAYTWPSGDPMVAGGWNEHMATYVIAAVRAAEGALARQDDFQLVKAPPLEEK